MTASASMRLTMPASTLPGPHSTMCVDAARADRLHRLDPAHRAEGLAIQRVADRRRVGLDRDVDVVDDRDLRRGDRRRRQLARAAARPPASSGCEWNGADTGSGSARLAPLRLEQFAGLLDAGLAAGDHGLLRVVEVDRFDHLAGCRARASAQPSRTALRRPGRGSPPSRRRRPAPPPAWPARESAPAAAPRPASARRRRPAPCTRRANARRRTAGSAPPSASQAR